MSTLVLVGLFYFLDSLLLYLVPRGMPYFLVTMSFEVVVLVGVLWMHSMVVCLCDGKLDVLDPAVTRWEMLYHFIFVLFWIHLLSDCG